MRKSKRIVRRRAGGIVAGRDDEIWGMREDPGPRLNPLKALHAGVHCIIVQADQPIAEFGIM